MDAAGGIDDAQQERQRACASADQTFFGAILRHGLDDRCRDEPKEREQEKEPRPSLCTYDHQYDRSEKIHIDPPRIRYLRAANAAATTSL